MKSKLVLIPIGVLFVSGCGNAGPTEGASEVQPEGPDHVVYRLADTGEELEPVTRISYPNGSQVSFFEPKDGELFVSQSGPNLVAPPIDVNMQEENLTPVDIYERLTKKAAPSMLLEAQQRAVRLQQAAPIAEGMEQGELDISTPASIAFTTGAGQSAGPDGITAKTSQALRYYDCVEPYSSYDEWFNCSFCNPANIGTFDYTWMWVTGSGSFTKRDKEAAWTTLSVYGGGSVHFVAKKLKITWSTKLDTYVPNGYWAQYAWGYSVTGYGIKAYTDHADGDSYHWCSWGYW